MGNNKYETGQERWLDSKLSALKNNLNAMRDEIDSIQTEMLKMGKQKDEKDDFFKRFFKGGEMAKLKERVAELESKNEKLESTLKDKEKDVIRLDSALEEMKRMLKDAKDSLNKEQSIHNKTRQSKERIESELETKSAELDKTIKRLKELDIDIYERYARLDSTQKLSAINDKSYISFVASISNPTNLKRIYEELSERFDGLQSFNDTLANPSVIDAYELGIKCLCLANPTYKKLNIKDGDFISEHDSREYFRHRNFNYGSRIKKLWLQGYKTGNNVLGQSLVFAGE